MQKWTSSNSQQPTRKYTRWTEKFEFRQEHPQDKEVIRILASKKPEGRRTQFVRDAIIMTDAAEQGDFKLFFEKYGGAMLMQGLIGTILPQTRITPPVTPKILEPLVSKEDTSAMMYDLLTN